MEERKQIFSEIPRGNGNKPAISEMKPEKAKKHIRKSSKKRRRKTA